jgi:hypothetical protein
MLGHAALAKGATTGNCPSLSSQSMFTKRRKDYQETDEYALTRG